MFICIASICIAGALPACAGIVQGVVLDHVSGRPLARAIVQLQPVALAGADPSRPQQTQTTRAGVGGQFTFAVRAGLYLLTTTRDAYFPASYGSRASGRPVPIEVGNDTVLFAELRMRRKGGLTGHVFDENGVAMTGIPVIAYRARLPLRSAGTATSDDRGIYRIGGLDPGKYWVRSAAQKLPDTSSWLPMFGLQTRETGQAFTHTVAVGNDTVFADINPEPGQLFFLGGLIACEAGSVTVTLSSEAGQRTAQGACGGSYRFEGLSPAAYEITAVTSDGSLAGFFETALDRDNENASIQLAAKPLLDIQVTMAGSNARARSSVRLFGRRQNLSESEPEVELRIPRAPVTPGYWEFRAEGPPGTYIQSIATGQLNRVRPAKPSRPTNAFDGYVAVGPGALALPRVQPAFIVISDKGCRITGRVLTDAASAKPVPGAPVFLLALGTEASRSIGGERQVVSDTEGRYQFDSLPPGEYRLVASFDVLNATEEISEVRISSRVTVTAGQTTDADLTLWTSPGFE